MSMNSAPEMTYGGYEAENVSTHQEAVPLPWFCGYAKLPARWLCMADNWGKWQKEEVFQCDIIGAFALGTVDGFLGLYIDGKLWPKTSAKQFRQTTGTAARYADIEVNGSRAYRLHWGISSPSGGDRVMTYRRDFALLGTGPGGYYAQGLPGCVPVPSAAYANMTWLHYAAGVPANSISHLWSAYSEVFVGQNQYIICLATPGAPGGWAWRHLNAAYGGRPPDAADPHPLYPNICYCEFRDLYFVAPSKRQLPNVEAVLWRAPQLPAWATGFPDPYMQPVATHMYQARDNQWTDSAIIHGGGVNPVLALLEMRTRAQIGLGEPEANFNVDNWRTMAQALDDPKYWISPCVTEQDDVNAICDQILEYFDGYAYRDTQGRLCLGRYEDAGVVVDPATLPQITEHDLVEPPKVTAITPRETINELTMEFKDSWDGRFKKAGITLYLPEVRLQRGSPVRDTIERHWIVQRWQAEQYAAKYLQTQGQQRLEGELEVRRDQAVKGDGSALGPGDRFALDYRPLGLDLVARIVEASTPFAGGMVRIKWESDRGQHPLPYVAPLDQVPELALPAVGRPAAWRVLTNREATYQAAALRLVSLWSLPEAESAEITGADAWVSTDGGTSYSETALAPAARSVRAELVADVSAAATSLTLDFFGPDAASLTSQTVADQANDRLLLVIRDEIISLGALVPVSGTPGRYTCTALRGRRGTLAAAQPRLEGAIPALAFVVPRPAWEAATFLHADLAQSWGGTCKIKLRPRNLFQPAGLGDDQTIEVSVALPARAQYAPAPTALALAVDGRKLSVGWTMPSSTGLSEWILVEYGRAPAQGSTTPPASSEQPARLWLKTSEVTLSEVTIAVPRVGWYWVRLHSLCRGIYSDPTAIEWAEVKVPQLNPGTAIIGPATTPYALELYEMRIDWSWSGAIDADHVLVEWWLQGSSGQVESRLCRATDGSTRVFLPYGGVWTVRRTAIDRDGQRGLPGSTQVVSAVPPDLSSPGMSYLASGAQAVLTWDLVPVRAIVQVQVECDYGTGSNWYGVGGAALSVGRWTGYQPSGVTWLYRARTLDSKQNTSAWTSTFTVTS